MYKKKDLYALKLRPFQLQQFAEAVQGKQLVLSLIHI